MKTVISLITWWLFATSIQAHAAIVAGPFINSATGNRYFLLAPDTWASLEAEAVSLGGHLATVRNPNEQAWLVSTFSPLMGNQSAFIGLTDRDVEGVWTWVSGESSPYRNWYPGEPNGGSAENYVELTRANDIYAGRWNDNTATAAQYGIAELVELFPRMKLRVAAVEVCWTTESDQMYQVEYRSALTTNVWLPLGSPIQGSGATDCITDSVGTEPRRFYRVRQLP